MAILIGVAGVEFIKTSIGRLHIPTIGVVRYRVLIFVLIALLIKISLGLFAKYVGKVIKSQTVEADSVHHYSNALSSLLVLIAILGVKFGYPHLDAVGGIIIGLLLLWACISISKGAINSIVGSPPAPGLIYKIHEVCQSVSGVLSVYDITLHSYGDRGFIKRSC